MKKLIVLTILTLILSIQTTGADIISPEIYYSKQVYIDKAGEIVPKKQAEPLYQSYFKQQAQNERSLVRFYDNDGKIGYKDEKGNIIIKPQFLAGDLNFRNGTAAVRIKGNKWGIINEKGNWVILPKYDLVLNFSEGLAGAIQDNKLGFIDSKGNWVIQPQFLGALCYTYGKYDTFNWKNHICSERSEFHEGLAPVYYDKIYKVYFDSNSYTAVMPENYPVEQHLLDKAVFGEIKDNKFYIKSNITDKKKQQLSKGNLYEILIAGYIDKQGNVVIKGDFYPAGGFSEGLAKIKKGEYGYIDKKGKIVIPPKYITASDLHNGIASVKIRDTYAEKN